MLLLGDETEMNLCVNLATFLSEFGSHFERIRGSSVFFDNIFFEVQANFDDTFKMF